MRKTGASLFFLLWCMSGFSQVPDKREKPQEPPATTEQQLENITENNADNETEDDSYLLALAAYQKNPLNINSVTETQLRSLNLITPLQIQNLIAYRKTLGDLLSMYELQSVPGWDISTIQKVRIYFTVNKNTDLISSLGSRLKAGDHTLLVRVTQTLEKSAGYYKDPALVKNYYPGSPQKLFLRYRYNYKNNLQYGVLGEKDAGEQFFKGAQKQGFDFYSAHFFVKDIGIIKAIALGDYTVNMGQGLTQWMSLAYKKGPDVLAVKRQADVLRPYNSSGEINFHRGAGITFGRKHWEASLFGSYRHVDANFAEGDTAQTADDQITSLQTSGYHRTASEVADKGIQRQLAFGGNFAYNINNIHVGINAIQYRFKIPLQKPPEPYNLYALSGKSFGNYSTDYSYTYKNFHFFGEAAISDKKYPAFITGLLLSAASNADISLVYRNISKGYQSLYTNAFTESTAPNNEKGLFSGISIRPTDAWRLDAYADFYKFPWLRFRVNAPASGTDYLIQLTYKPNRVFEIYTRYKSEKKSVNFNSDNAALSPVVSQPKKNWRTQFSYKITSAFTFRSRAEVLWFDSKRPAAGQGFLIYTDVLYKPALKPFNAGVRLQYFETDGYNSRLYAYENDVAYSFSIPVFYDKGYRYYINFNYDISKKLSIWARIAQYFYPVKTVQSASLDQINGNYRTEAKLQALYKF